MTGKVIRSRILKRQEPIMKQQGKIPMLMFLEDSRIIMVRVEKLIKKKEKNISKKRLLLGVTMAIWD